MRADPRKQQRETKMHVFEADVFRLIVEHDLENLEAAVALADAVERLIRSSGVPAPEVEGS